MPFSQLLRFVDSALGVMGWTIELLPYFLTATCVAAYVVRICAAIVTTTCFVAIFMETQATPAVVVGLEAEGEAEDETKAEEEEEEAEIEAVCINLPTRNTTRRPPGLALLALPETWEDLDSNVPVLRCFRQSPSQRGPRLQRGFGGAVQCVGRSVITASSFQKVHQLILTTRRLAAASGLQSRWRELVAQRAARHKVAVRRNAQAKRQRRQTAALLEAYPEFACCSPEVSAPLAVAIADRFFFGRKRILGAGAFGTVYRPRGWEAAVKVVSLRGADREIPQAAADLAKEARLLQMASADGGNPHVLRMHAAFTMGDHACIALDLATGGDLLRYMHRTHRGRMPQAEALLYVQQLAAAVEWLHLCGVAHRDIKLDNVLLREPGHVMLADLGLGIDLSSLEEWGGQYWCKEDCGTRTTMAPEVIDCAYSEYGYVPKFADVWSLGVTALALLAPRTPDEHGGGDDRHGYYAWSVANEMYDGAYGQYVRLHDAATAAGPTAIAELLQASDDTSDDTSDEPAASDERRHQVPQQLPAAVLQALDGMLRIDPDHRISATDVVSLLRADPCHSEC